MPKTMINIPLAEGQKVFFASDHHFGVPSHAESLKREKHFVAWLDEIKDQCAALILAGDLFDFWFEYKKVVPRGFTRVLGKLAEFTDAGIPVYFFVGNHDLWMNGYFEEELNIPVYHQAEEFSCNGKILLVGHGDGLGPGDKGFKRMKKIFTNPVCKKLFSWVHPNFAIGVADFFSGRSRAANRDSDKLYLGDDKEWLLLYCKRKLESKHYDYFVFGHRHLAMDKVVGENSRYINLGDWVSDFTYGEFDGEEMSLKSYPMMD